MSPAESASTKVGDRRLMGRVCMEPLEFSFPATDVLLEQLKQEGQSKVMMVGFHAEATSEKQAMGW